MEAKVISFWLPVFLSSILLIIILCEASTSSGLSPFGLFKNLQGCKKGDKVEGIHKVRKYLQRFGYLSSTHFHDDDYFDDSLESAIKSFQRYYHLTPTGILDGPTADQMSKPRCGVPDNLPSGVINNTNSDFHGHLNNTFSIHYAFLPGKPVWPIEIRHLLYFLDSGSHPEAVDAVARSFDAWAGVSVFTFEPTSDPAAAHLQISFQVGDHGDGFPFDGRGGVVGHASPPVTGIFHFDGDENWVVGAVENGADLQTVATHEIGHLLGLAHSSVQEAIMFAAFTTGQTKGLNKDDVDGINTLYMAPGAYDPTKEIKFNLL